MSAAPIPTTRVYRLLSGSFLYLSLAVLACTGVRAESTQILTRDVDLDCSQSEMMLACSWRLLGPEAGADISAVSGGHTLQPSASTAYPAADSITAILFLVDTSDPGRQDVIARNATQIERMLAATTSRHRYGLASFDHDLVINVPVGTDREAIITSARQLKASGMTTELYRSTLRAVELLGQIHADRKVIFLMSDGQAEDRAWFHDDVIRTAEKYGVIINSLGYPRSVTLSVALQTLRRLSEETGGIFLQTGMDFELPQAFLQAPLANVDRGGQFIFDLTPLQSSPTETITARFRTAASEFTASIPVQLKAPAVVAPAAVTTPALPVVVPATLPALPPVTEEKSLLDTLLWYGLPLLLLVISLLLLIALLLVYRRQDGNMVPASVVPMAEHKPAWLIRQDAAGKRFQITTATCRIGRSRDNEMAIHDNSVSRRHAEIRRTFDGQYILYDRDSTNGVYVNDQKIRQHRLSEGDVIEIGDVFILFTQKPSDPGVVRHFGGLKTLAP